MTRYEKLHCDEYVKIADKIKELALDAEEKTGRPVIKMTKYRIARLIKEDEQVVSNALRLASTAEFFDECGYMFLLPGNGRPGDIHGYILHHNNSKAGTVEALTTLEDASRKDADHLRGRAAFYYAKYIAHGEDTYVGMLAKENWQMLIGAATAVNKTLPDWNLIALNGEVNSGQHV
jgi:hypothetical protein